jgi:hypothetical protein
VSIASSAFAAQPVLQRGYDPAVTGSTLTETVLTPASISPTTFGLSFTLAVDDTVYAQPLYVPNVTLKNGKQHNLVIVATMSDTLYAFDADSGGRPLWQLDLAASVGAMSVPMAQFAFYGNRNIVGNLGVLSTPVIDPATQIMYVVAATLEGATLAYRLHAVDISTGKEPYGPGTLIVGSDRGTTFDARNQTQRVSLALSGNHVVFGFGAVQLEDVSHPYAGWVMAYDKRTLQQSGVFATITTGNRGGGVWQSGRPPAVDASGNVYVFVGNGWDANAYDGANNFSESVLKLNPANGLALLDWYTPSNWYQLDRDDRDLTSSGPLLIPGTNLLAGGGKGGVLYVLKAANLGKFDATDSQVVQKLAIGSALFGGPVLWQRSMGAGGPILYNWPLGGQALKAYAFNGSTFDATPISQSAGGTGFPGGILTLSANGEQSGSGVLWATTSNGGDALNNPPVPGVLRAFNAQDLSAELWNSTMNGARDDLGGLAKYVPPLVANGKVYVATSSNRIAVYGLLPACQPSKGKGKPQPSC